MEGSHVCSSSCCSLSRLPPPPTAASQAQALSCPPWQGKDLSDTSSVVAEEQPLPKSPAGADQVREAVGGEDSSQQGGGHGSAVRDHREFSNAETQDSLLESGVGGNCGSLRRGEAEVERKKSGVEQDKLAVPRGESGISEDTSEHEGKRLLIKDKEEAVVSEEPLVPTSDFVVRLAVEDPLDGPCADSGTDEDGTVEVAPSCRDPLLAKERRLRPHRSPPWPPSQADILCDSEATNVFADKRGFLKKLSGRTFPYIPQWKERYCVLWQNKLFCYDRKDNRPLGKPSRVIRLEYFEKVIEAPGKGAKKASHVFMLTSQDKSFFDPGRYLFAAESLTDMRDWISSIQSALDRLRSNKRQIHTSRRPKKQRLPPLPQKPNCAKSDSAEIQSKNKFLASGTTSTICLKEKEEAGTKETVYSHVEPEAQEVPPHDDKMEGQRDRIKLHSEKVTAKVSKCTTSDLTHITKSRVKGPTGRRAPKLKKTTDLRNQRASSLSALPPESTDDPTDRVLPNWKNRSLVFMEEKTSSLLAEGPRSSPALAYWYSSEEDDCDSYSRGSVGTSASGHTSSLPPASVSSSKGAEQQYFCPIHQVIYEHPPRDQADHIPSPTMDDLDNILMNQSVQRLKTSSEFLAEDESDGSTCKALTPASPTHQDDPHFPYFASSKCSKSCELVQRFDAGSARHKKSRKTRHLKELNKFSASLLHMRRHVAEINHSAHDASHSLITFTERLASLQDALKDAKNDVLSIRNDISGIADDAGVLREQVTTALQEVEATQKSAALALLDLEKSKKEHEKMKMENIEIMQEAKQVLEELRGARVKTEQEKMLMEMKRILSDLKEMKSAFGLPKSVGEIVEQILREQQRQRMEEEQRQVRKIISEPLEAKDAAKDKRDKSDHSKCSEKQKGSKSQKESSVFGSYQSLFSRPSSLISGITHKAHVIKSVSFTDQHNDENDQETKSKNDVKIDKKHKKEDDKKDDRRLTTHRMSDGKEQKSRFDRGSSRVNHKKEKCKVSPIDDSCENLHENPIRGSQIRNASDLPRPKSEAISSNFSFEDISMIDTTVADQPSKPVTSVSKVMINVGQIGSNYQLGKSSSTPSISSVVRSPAVNLALADSHDRGYSNSSSENEAALDPVSLSMMPLGSHHNHRHSSSSFSPRKGIAVAGSQAKQMCMSTVPEEGVQPFPLEPPQRKGVFALSRQSSTPSLPLHRHGSTCTPHLQRQLSLGRVPEEDSHSPQGSLISVQEKKLLVDRTLPLSPSLFPQAGINSGGRDSDSRSATTKDSLELLTGPLLAGMSLQGSTPAPLALGEFTDDPPIATSSLKRNHEKKCSGEPKLTKEVIV